MLDVVAGGFLVFFFVALALFQLAIVLGAPLGEYAFGGQRSGVLPTGFRIASFFSMALAIAIAGHYLAQLGLLSPLLNADLNQVANWGLVGFAALSALVNNITRSEKEKKLWGGPTLAALVAAVIVAL